MSSTATFTFTMSIISATTVAIGFIGHIITILTFLRKPFRNNSISTYCISLAIVECLALVKLAQYIAATLSISLNDLSEELCKSLNYILVLFISIQPFITVVFAIDKLLSMRTRSIPILKKKWFQLSIVAAIVVVNAGIYMYYPILLKRRQVAPDRLICDFSTASFFPIYMAEILIEAFIVPFVVMIVTSVLTIRQLYKSRGLIERLGNVDKDRKSRDTKYAITSMVLNIMFIILKLPFFVFYLLNGYFAYYNVYFLNISAYLFYLYSSLSFFVHLATNSIFRRELLLMFGLKDRNEVTISYSRSNRIIPMPT